MTAGWFQRIEWVQLDGWGRIIGRSYDGTHEDLLAHLASQATPHVRVITEDAMVYVAPGEGVAGEQVQTVCVTVAEPWGRQRWIPRPTRRREI